MVIIKLTGGLSNQIFQYAFSLQYLQKAILVKYDTSVYQRFAVHNGLQLKKAFKNITIIEASKRDIFYFLESHIINEIKQFTLKCNRYIIDEEKEFAYCPSINLTR